MRETHQGNGEELVLVLEACPPDEEIPSAEAGPVVEGPPEPAPVSDTVLLGSLAPEEAVQAMRRAADWEEVLTALALGAHHVMPRVGLFLFTSGALSGYLAIEGGQMDLQRVRKQRLMLDDDSLVGQVMGTGVTFIGRSPPAHQGADLGLGDGEMVALAPVIVGQRVHSLLVGTFDGDDPELRGHLARLTIEAGVELGHRGVPREGRPHALTTSRRPARSLPGSTLPADPDGTPPRPGDVASDAVKSLALLGVLLDDEDWSVRRDAAHDLRLLREGERPEALRKAIVARLELGDPEGQIEACRALGALGDLRAVPALLGALDQGDRDVSRVARRALMMLTKQDFKTDLVRWRSWWNDNRYRPWEDLLFDGLVHRSASIRARAAVELEELMGHCFGYDAHLPRKEREQISQRCREQWNFERWWTDNQISEEGGEEGARVPPERQLGPGDRY